MMIGDPICSELETLGEKLVSIGDSFDSEKILPTKLWLFRMPHHYSRNHNEKLNKKKIKKNLQKSIYGVSNRTVKF